MKILSEALPLVGTFPCIKILRKIFNKLAKDCSVTNYQIMFISPHKLIRNLEDMKEVFGDIEVVLAHELTKIHQSVNKKKISKWLTDLKRPKGEYILLWSRSY